MNFRIVTMICATLTAASVLGWHFLASEEASSPGVEPAMVSAGVDETPPESGHDFTPPTVGAHSQRGTADSRATFQLPEVVGRPFVLSSSVLDSCRRIPWMCADVDGFLTRLRAEDRRESWARDLESRIARATLTRADGRYTIRALECRESRCAIEVTSEVDSYDFHRIFDDDRAFDELMWPTAATFATESDPATGIQTLVSVQTWATEAVALSESEARRRGKETPVL